MSLTQGELILKVREMLAANSWRVIYSCTPNTPHLGVVAITTPDGPSRQLYPDILATDGAITRLIEVEPSLNAGVAADIAERLSAQSDALEEPAAWDLWRRHIERTHEIEMPTTFVPELDLVVCNALGSMHEALINQLSSSGITVSDPGTFSA